MLGKKLAGTITYREQKNYTQKKHSVQLSGKATEGTGATVR